MNRAEVTYAIAHAAGTDAANRNAASEGRTFWNQEDFSIAADTFARLMVDSDIYQHQEERAHSELNHA
jgi:hypothetical protein